MRSTGRNVTSALFLVLNKNLSATDLVWNITRADKPLFYNMLTVLFLENLWYKLEKANMWVRWHGTTQMLKVDSWKCTSYLASSASPPSYTVICSLKGYSSVCVCVLPQQAAVCRRRSASCWWSARLWSWLHSQQRADWPGTNQSLRPPQCPLGSCGPRDATCGCHIRRRVDPDPAYGWNWADTWHTNQWWYNMST